MSTKLITLRTIVLVAGILTLAACAQNGSAPMVRPATHGSLVVPDQMGGHWNFSETVVEHSNGQSFSVPGNAGHLLGSATDMASSWSAVAYQNQLATLFTRGGAVDFRNAAIPSSAPGLAIGAGLLGVTGEQQAQLYDLNNGELVWQAPVESWMDEANASRLHAMVPQDSDHAVFIGSRDSSILGADAAALIHRIDHSQGRISVISRDEVYALSRVQGVANIGPVILVAGIKEAYQFGSAQGKGRSFVSTVVVRFDADTGLTREVVRTLEHERGRAVIGFIAGVDAQRNEQVALLLDSGQILVYRILDQGLTASPIFDITIPGTYSIAWIDTSSIVTRSDNGTKILKIN